MQSTTNTCDLCRFWKRMTPFDHIQKGRVERGVCFRFQMAEHELPEDEIALPPRTPGDHGFSGESGRVITGPKFGCL
jgi:hypothetical protein